MVKANGARSPGRVKLTVEDEPVKVLYYGDYGTGKTTALAGALRLGRVIFVDAESGLKARPLKRLGLPIEKAEVHRAISWPDLDRLFWELKAEIENEERKYAALVFDSVTEVQKKVMEQVVAQDLQKAERRGLERDRWLTTMENWGTNTQQMRDLVRKFRDLPMHVGFAALERRDQDDDGHVKYGPALTPALASDLGGYVDIVIHTTLERVGDEVFYIGHTQPVGKWAAKDRFAALPTRMINPSFDRVIAYVEGRLTPESDPVLGAEKARLREARAREKEEVTA